MPRKKPAKEMFRISLALGRNPDRPRNLAKTVTVAIDFDLLKQELSADIVEGPQERYRLNWPGKREALITANTPITKTLRPHRQESVDFDTTENLFIEGDNLDALKLLQEAYLGKVKMIYIDPPYNTGNDFIYTDSLDKSRSENDIAESARNEEGTKLIDEEPWKRNLRYNGRFHSDWLSMMYPRLKLARNLLKDDGVIFISIDDHEASNIQKICSEIFGDENFLGVLSWVKRTKPINSGDAKYQIQQKIEYVLVYCKSKNRPNTYAFSLPIVEIRTYNQDGKYGKCRIKDIEDSDVGSKKRDSMKFEIFGVKPGEGKRWKLGKDEVERLIGLDRVRIIDGKVKIEIYPQEEDEFKRKPFWSNFDTGTVGTAEEGKAAFNELMGEKLGFDTIKPLDLLTTLMTYLPCENEIILDFFAGTATTAHAVMQLNAEDGGKRKFIMVQLPDDCDKKSEAFKAGYENIAEISKERIRRAGKKIKEENTEVTANLDIGFRVLKIDTSNMVDIENTPDAIEQGQLKNLIENIKQDRGSEDLLFQVLLNWGVDLTLPITTDTIKGLEVFFVDKNVLVACFERPVTEELCKELANRKPLRVVFRDSGFENDSVKVNVEQIFKLLSPGTDVKTI